MMRRRFIKLAKIRKSSAGRLCLIHTRRTTQHRLPIHRHLPGKNRPEHLLLWSMKRRTLSSPQAGWLNVDQPDSTVEVGYWVAPWARGRGVATAATRAVTRWAIEELGAKRVTLEAASTNYASQQVALNAGFTAKAFKDPKPHDSENAMTWCCSLCCPAKDNTDTAASPCIVNEQAPLRRKPFPGRDVLRFNGRFSAAVLTSCRADHAAASVPSRSAVLRCRSASARSRSACASASLTALSSAPGLSTSTP